MERFLIAALFLLNVGTAYGLSFDRGVTADLRNQITSDLNFIGTLQGNSGSKLHTEIFGAVEGGSYSTWFSSRIQKVGVSKCGNQLAVACVTPLRGSDKMFVTENYTKFSHPQIARLMILFHEARHTEKENGFWGHAVCPKPYRYSNGTDIRSIWTGSLLEGEPACDVTPYGSYGSSTILLKNISNQCTNCNEKVKMDAGLYAADQVNRMMDINAKNEVWNDSFLTKNAIQ